MRAVFVNHCHPEMDHVCATRINRFAEILAGQGHQIVILCEILDPSETQDHHLKIADHDWARPYVLACRPTNAPLLERLHKGRLPGGLRQAVIAAGYLFNSGVFSHWRAGSQEAIEFLAAEFVPDVVWATFGNTDAWNIARDLAHRAGCPWVADMKDNWDHYIPGPFRQLLARRFKDAAHFTALSEGHAELVRRRFGTPARVVYSGFWEPQDLQPDGLRIVASGSIFDGQALAVMVRGIGDWLDRDRPDDPVDVCYFGNDHQRAEDIFAPLADRARITVRPYVDPVELAPLLGQATVILGPRHPPMLYHHKFGEYMSTGRPLISLPGETSEGRKIAADINAPLFSCETAKDVTAALQTIVAGDYPQLDLARLANYSWQAQADVLQSVLAAHTRKAQP